MGSLRLFAIGVDEVRDLFGATEAVAADFRAVAAEAFPPAPVRSPGLLSKLGPLFRHPPDAPVIRPEDPTETDVATLLAGQYVPPPRLLATWRLIDAWLAAKSWDRVEIDLDDAGFSELEFALARAGLAPQFALAKLITKPLGIPLRLPPGLVAGHAKYAHALASREAWRAASATLEPEHAEVADRYLAFLDTFAENAEAAPRGGRPVPDLVGLFRSRPN